MRLGVKIAIAVVLIAAIVASIGAYVYIQNPRTKVNLIVATTTSLYDTGLEDGNTTTSLKSAFEAAYPDITVSFVAKGTGAAIAAAQAGDADMLLVHSPSQEITFLTGGFGVDRKIIAYNFFIMVGPSTDPANISGLSPTAAMKKIYDSAKTNTAIQWVARNDSSGTATKEISLWAKAVTTETYASFSTNTTWFICTGSGMGASLLVANQKNAYILSDLGTYLAYKGQGNIPQLTVLVQSNKDLLNVYSAIIDNPTNANLNSTHFAESLTFVTWLVSDAGQEIIGDYGVSTYGQALFNPFIPLASGSVNNATLLGWIKGAAYYNSTNQLDANGTECPSAYRYNATELYNHSWDTITVSGILQPPAVVQISFSQSKVSATVNIVVKHKRSIDP
jgi:tungstate transport system substrate-binding protein